VDSRIECETSCECPGSASPWKQSGVGVEESDESHESKMAPL
jgi:hypothetical protein